MNTKSLICALSLTLLCACQQFPAGSIQPPREALTPQQQAEYQAQQQANYEQRRVAEEQQRQIEATRQAQERAIAAERERVEQERLRAAYRRARYGDILTVTIQGGTVDYGGTGRAYEPVAFDLLRGETKLVEIAQKGRADRRISVPMRLSEDGHTFFMDHERARDRIALIDGGWEKGHVHGPLEVTDHISVSRARGITIALKWKELPGGPRRANTEERRPSGR